MNAAPLTALRIAYTIAVLLLVVSTPAHSHHVNPDRPTYVLATDGKPDGIRVQDHVGALFLRLIGYPAHPSPGQPVEIELTARERNGGGAYDGRVAIQYRLTRTPFAHDTPAGMPRAENGLLQHQLSFDDDGFYVVSAHFDYRGEPYRIDLPIRCGNPLPIWPLTLVVGFVVFVLASVAIVKRQRANAEA